MLRFLFSIVLITVCFLSNLSLKANEKGAVVLQPSFNIGGYYGGPLIRPNNGVTIGSTLNFDYSVHDYFAAGLFAGFTSYINANAEFRYRRVGLGGRGVFHWWKLLDDKVSKDLMSDKIEFYLPLYAGVHIINTNIGNFGGTTFFENDTQFRVGAGLGFRYFFNPGFAAALEWGYQEMSWAKLGVAIKF